MSEDFEAPSLIADDSQEYSLAGSVSLLGQLQPVIMDRDGNVIDGFHRKEVDKEWWTIKNESVDSLLKLAAARLVSNLNRRRVDGEEISQRLGEIYQAYKDQSGSFPSAKIVGEWLGRIERWVRC